MDFYEQIEFDSEVYTSIWIIQKLLSGYKDDKRMKSVGISEIKHILQNPLIFLIRNGQNDDIISDSKFLVRGSYNGRPIISSQKENPDINMTRPFAVVCLLGVEGNQGKCHLQLDACKLLDKANTFLRRKEDVVYIVKYNAIQVTYDDFDLHMVSEEIQQLIYGKGKMTSRNRIYPKLFFMHDEQIHIRIGLCLNDSILCHLKQIYRKIQQIIREVDIARTKLSQERALCIKSMKKQLLKPCFKNRSFTSLRTKQTVIDVLSVCLLKCIEGFADSRIWSLDNMMSIIMDIIRNRLDRLLILTNPPRPRYITRSNLKQFKGRGAFTNGRTKSKENVQRNTGSRYIWAECKITSIAKAIFRISFRAINKSLTAYQDKLSALCRNIQDEFTKRGDNVSLHEWKVVSERNPLVKGFGYVDGRISISIRKDDVQCKEKVSSYLQQYFDMSKYRVSIEYKNRKFIPFSNLEQGSRINREDAEKYGTLGMFFKDEAETYFFTTCAHVIGENAIAYTNNSRIGKNVYICDSGSTMNTQESHMDLSLIEVSPERTLTCTFGLKALAGNFIEGHIFDGDLSEIRHRTVYKWGATKPYFRQGKCIGFDSDGAVLILKIDTNSFAGPGDSGSIICIGDNPELGLAAFVLVGGDSGDGSDVATYAVYKVSDAIKKVSQLRRQIKPCLIPFQKSFIISESMPQSTQRRKRQSSMSDKH